MIKKIIITALFGLVVAFSGFGVYSVRGSTENLYQLENYARDGDFNVPGSWLVSGNVSITDSVARFTTNVGESAFGQGDLWPVGTYTDYVIGVCYTVTESSFVGTLKIGDLYGASIYDTKITLSTTLGRHCVADYVQPGDGNAIDFHATGYTGTLKIDNVMVFNFTNQFGAGQEPSASNFLILYLPILPDYFENYTSFQPDNSRILDSDDYTNLSSLDEIDFNKSVIAYLGTNVNVDMYMYFYDSDDYLGTEIAGWYRTTNIPMVNFSNKEYNLNWKVSDYSNRVNQLDMSSEEQTALKMVLFNRLVDSENEFFRFESFIVDWDIPNEVRFWFVITSAFDLRVNIDSFLVSSSLDKRGNVYAWNPTFYLKMFDENNNIMYPALQTILPELETTTLYKNFGSIYTNVKRFNFEFVAMSPELSDQDSQYHYIYELGLFSSSDIFIPVIVDSDIGNIFDNQICDIFQFGCHFNNIINNTGARLYSALQIDTILGFFDNIITKTGVIIDILPDELKVIALIVVTSSMIGLVFVIVDKIKG